MTEDAILRDFLLDAAAAEFAAELNDTAPVDVSPRLLRQMTAMLNDPNGWAKRRHRPVWKRIARAAAVILLTFTLSLSALMAINPSVRAAVITWVREVYEHSVVYRFFARSETELPEYAPIWIPEGFALDERVEFDGRVLYMYHNSNTGEMLSFSYEQASADTQVQIGGYDDEPVPVSEPCTVNGMPADYYPISESGTSNLVWIDEVQSIVFTINSTLEKDVMLHIAEGVSSFNSTKPK